MNELNLRMFCAEGSPVNVRVIVPLGDVDPCHVLLCAWDRSPGYCASQMLTQWS
jgi:hypothetical protein